MALTTTSTLPGPVAAYYEKAWLDRANKTFILEGLGKMGRIPKGEGKTVVWNRMTNPSAKTSLTEGTDPTPSGMSATLVSATLAQYGNYEQVTDVLELTAVDTTVEEVVDTLAYEAALSIDSAIRDTIIAGGTVMYVTGAYGNSAGFNPTRNSIQSTDLMTVYDVRRAKKQLRNFSARPHRKSNRYVVAAHEDVIFDLEGDSNWVNGHIYTEKGIEQVYNGEAGEMYGTKWLSYDNATVLTNSGSAGTEVYPTLFIGNEFFGVSKLQKLQTYVDSPSPRSPLRLYSDIGWKASFAVKVLNDSFAVRMETSATA